MEGVGARLGRSSTRYGPATVFTGPVRKWRKKWVPLTPSQNNNGNSGSNHHHHHHHHLSSNGTTSASSSAASHSNGNGSSSHLLLYKWTPLTPSSNGAKDNSTPVKADTKDDADERPKRKYKYLPVHLLENEKKDFTEKEATEIMDDGGNPVDVEASTVLLDSKDDTFDEKPDINDVPMDENQDEDPVVCQDLNESLDLSLGLNSRDVDSDPKTEFKDGQLERANESNS